MRLRISKDSAGRWGIAREGPARYAWTRYWLGRSKPGEARWRLVPFTSRLGETTTTIIIVLGGWKIGRVRQTDRAGEHIARMSRGGRQQR